MKIYTKNGDDGNTDIRNSRHSKDDPIFDLIGNIDELSSSLGLVHTIRNKTIRKIVLDLQDDLFSIGGNIAQGKKFEYKKEIKKLENQIDSLSKNLEPLRNFILPGGSRFSAQLQHSRSIARRAERSAVALKKKKNTKKLPLGDLIVYLNRLSDLLFVMARYVNFKLGIKEIIWPTKE